MIRKAITGLARIDLPSATVRLCDGGVIYWGADTFIARDTTYGVIGAVQSMSEGAADELPPMSFTILPPSIASSVALCDPANQGSRVRLWLAEYDIDTSAVTGTPELRFDGEIDEATLNLGDNSVDLTVIAKAARLFELNIGNALSPAWHKSVWPGETGHDNATGLGRAIAWGVASPPATMGNSGDPYTGGYNFAVPF